MVGKSKKKRENGEGIRFPAVNAFAPTKKEGDGLVIFNEETRYLFPTAR